MISCVFCRIVEHTEPAFIVLENDRYLAFLDIFPQTRGHMQLIPKRHYRWVWEVPDMGELFATAQTVIRGIIPVLGADHVTIGTFGHEVEHAHVWIVPQYARSVELSEWKKVRTDKKYQETLARRLHHAL